MENTRGGVNQDEAYAGYEAYSLLHYGVDSHGYVNPVYLVLWGSGMDALYSYLSIPFIAILGLNKISIRIVQAIFSIIMLVFIYKLQKKVCGEKCALWTMFLMAIVPWRIMMSRWGLDCNIAPTFLVIAWYYMVKVVDDNKYIILSFLFYGLSLYCYATLWILVPVMIFFQVIYLFSTKNLRLNLQFFIAVLILGILALPLCLFLLVQWGCIPEIKTNVISIPLLTGFRGDEVGFSDMIYNFKNLVQMIWLQNDYWPFNSDGKYGLYYLISNFFIVLGIGILVYQTISAIKNRKFDLKVLYIINFVTILFQASLIANTNVNKIVSIHVIIIILIGMAIEWLIRQLQNKKFEYGLIVVYVCLFLCFTKYYYTDYGKQIAGYFQQNLEDALRWENNRDSNKDLICVGDVNYAKVLYITKYPVQKFIETVDYTNYPDPWLSVAKFGTKGEDEVKFVAEVDVDNIEYNSMYICKTDYEQTFMDLGFQLEKFGDWMVAYY